MSVIKIGAKPESERMKALKDELKAMREEAQKAQATQPRNSESTLVTKSLKRLFNKNFTAPAKVKPGKPAAKKAGAAKPKEGKKPMPEKPKAETREELQLRKDGMRQRYFERYGKRL